MDGRKSQASSPVLFPVKVLPDAIESSDSNPRLPVNFTLRQKHLFLGNLTVVLQTQD